VNPKTPPNALKIELQRADVTGRISKDLVLATSPLVKALGPAWPEFFKKGQAKRANDRALLFQQGDHGSSLLFLLSGHVRLAARKEADTVELGLAHAGDVVGEAEVLHGAGPRTMSAVANGQVEGGPLDQRFCVGHAGGSSHDRLVRRRAGLCK
jgi:hypothetical protein